MTKKTEKVLATGVFDILHQEHINFLKKAKEFGSLYVGLESDVRVRKIKGEGRPINSQEVRKQNLEDLGIADQVFILPETFDVPEERLKLLKELSPNVLAVSSNSPHLENKARLMQEIGGRVAIVHQFNPEFSTTKIIDAQKKLSS
jgi:cytidyltransferase-like protein